MSTKDVMVEKSKLNINLQRSRDFWDRKKVDRPLLAAWMGNFEVGYNYRTGLAKMENGLLLPSDISFESFREDYERLYTAHLKIDEDIPWAAFPLMVFPWVEAILGSPISNKDGNIQAEHGSFSSAEIIEEKRLRLDWLDVLLEFLDWLNRLSEGRFPVAMSLMRGPVDLLSVLRGAEQTIFDIYDQPENVTEALKVITRRWESVAEAQQKHIVPWEGGYSFSLQTLWAEQRCGWFQDDALSYWSPDLYRQYVLSSEQKLAGNLPLTGIHLHSGALYTVDDLVQIPELDVIEVNLDDVGMSIAEMMPWFKTILEHKRLYILGDLSDSDLQQIHDELPTAGLALQLIGMTPEIINSRIEMVKKIWSA